MDIQTADAYTDTGPMGIPEYAQIVREIANQPPWRSTADKEADYADGNQLDSDLLRRQRQLGVPPAKENIITPAIAAVCGYEAKTRTDWRVTPDGDIESKDIADALNYRLNQAERHSRADKALSNAFRAMVAVGVGWVEVTRAANSLEYPYKCRYVHRNEIWWDMRSQEHDLSDARWLRRRRWVDKAKAARLFPQHRELLMRSLAGWMTDEADTLDGGTSTRLHSALEAERAWTSIEDAWYNTENRTVAIDELWYRRWEPRIMLKIGGATGKAMEYDETSMVHQAALMSGQARLVEEVIPVVRRAYWVGPHCLHDGESPYPHRHFPYVPLFGYREDMTGIPVGLVRDMLFPQDNLNSSISKLRWGMASTRTERTKGAVAMSDEQFRRMAARVDADIILDPMEMSKPGARFEVKRDFQLSEQQFKLMQDSRQAVQRVSGITDAFMGQAGSATSGLQEQTQLEQSQISQADLMDNFHEARTQVGELLMALIIEDMGKEPQTVVIEGDVLNPSRTVQINVLTTDPETGVRYLSNDVSRARLQVALDDVPTSSGFRAQQLNALTEAVKSAPPQLQQVILPYMVHMMDLPKKEDIVQAVMQAQQQQDPEAIREQVKQEMLHDLKERELELREREIAAKEKLLEHQAVNTGVTSTFAAIQTAEKIAMNPLIAPVGDVVLQNAGWQKPSPQGADPNLPGPGTLPQPVGGAVQSPQAVGGEQGDTSPLTPSNPVSANVNAGQGIETLRAD